MPVHFDSKKAKKNARKHAEARAKAFPSLGTTLSPTYGKTWAVAESEVQAVANWGWGNENGSMRFAPASEIQAAVGSGGWDVQIPWMDGITTNSEDKKVPEWVDTTPPKTEGELLKERVEKALVGWPWKCNPKKLVTVAPFTLNETVKFKLPEVSQTCSLFAKLFNDSIVLDTLTEILFRHHDAAWKFAATCKDAWRLMSWNIDTWDITRGNFHNCDLPRTGKGAPEDPFNSGSVASIIVVTPVRCKEGPASYYEQIQNLNTMCLSISNFAEYFRHIQLHRIPFLTTEILALLVPKMTGLKILGIYNCQLIHVGETIKLLNVIKTDRLLGREKQISLDFSPNYHLGPIEEPGNPYSMGSYGVTWDNWNYDSTLSIWALMARIVPQARSQGIDFESEHTAFRQWLERSPCHKVGETLAAMMDPDMPQVQIAAMVNYRRTLGNSEMLQQCNRPKLPTGKSWAIKSYRCAGCHERLMGIFFSYKNIVEWEMELAPRLICSGCLLVDHLRAEGDHYKREKRRIISSWLAGPDGWNRDDLSKALADFHNRGVAQRARELDDKRLHDSTTGPDPYDRELNERQRPYTKQELSGRKSMHGRSPQVGEQLSGKGYDYIRVERYDGHGL